MGSPAAGVPGNGGRLPDRAPGSDRGPSVQGPSWSRQLGDERYRVSQAHRSGHRDAGVEAAHAPAWGGEIALLHLPIVDFRPERFAVDIERGAWAAGLGDLYLRSEEHTSELQSLRHLVCRLPGRKEWSCGSLRGNHYTPPADL